MNLRPTIKRSLTFTLTALVALLVAACGPGAENARTDNAAPATPAAANNNAPTRQPGGDTAAPAAAGAKLNLNTASENDFLTGVPGLGKRMAHEFEEYRPYRSVQQFRREMAKYVSADQIREYEKFVFVPVAENDADAATLAQIPGLDAAEAAELIAGRPYASREAFLAKLAGKVSAEELAAARSYLSAQ